ncbi:MAG: NUDIX domain-containing protein [Muricauda sp.]|jgi:nudix-type nucleoside diphosphatase (YffH/AdpP family)|nr:NUDIX domain-containing protein [Allomuricauda sp.]MBO6588924.1 NUDIX domain-containing protein [Allomuricauda sp.]MBO6618549.1 NUDIX domain-containing protein [Allomuricauda sp.]MBO6644462.1 NUDIX domain-containing protein [Allomuricauda sp.]MBO6746362.1 NUDIX domain-containing protein [Allomuricauda sp.]MBO6845565.1 NUDIX domain-containing protein [Allomuricauda sp.]
MQNNRVRNIERELLSDNWYSLEKITFEYLRDDGVWEKQIREAYDRGNGAVILLYNVEKGTVVLTKQFRMPTYVNGNADGMMIEACAGILEKGNAEETIKMEVEEETGYKIEKVKKVFESYMSPGSVTEILYFFIGAYKDEMKISEGGGADDETENIEVLELDFKKALAMMKSGEIKDAKTIMLLQYAQIEGIFNQ